MDTFTLHHGTAPLLVSLPHDGSEIPADIAARMHASARRAPDTDWHVARLYAFARDLGASVLVPRHSRYVVDLNRPPDDVSLYPGQNTTGLCPIVQFSGEPVYVDDDQHPTPAEIQARVERYWRPYHAALAGELQRLRAQHPRVVLWEGHSIRGECPFLFDGRLPDFNLGTAGGGSCSPALQDTLVSILSRTDGYDFVANGRFKGGYITRHYGDPANGIDAVQLEISQRTYMDEDSFAWDDARAAGTQRVLRTLLESVL
ncbi:N-formylglutamate deformylase [Cognatiluteimonas telluris]|uniref:N-formylglutamate deformylase n=1 Tax=Cognatiluteimonas telluris TaxID=1104775 RepID=UPI00140AB4AC|nr:N-formylglutamate deformylase [Lysobacter telluris]